jgi:hypothetical protein
MFGLSPSSPTRKYWQDVQVGKIMAIARASPKIAQQRVTKLGRQTKVGANPNNIQK